MELMWIFCLTKHYGVWGWAHTPINLGKGINISFTGPRSKVTKALIYGKRKKKRQYHKHLDSRQYRKLVWNKIIIYLAKIRNSITKKIEVVNMRKETTDQQLKNWGCTVLADTLPQPSPCYSASTKVTRLREDAQ